MYYVRRKTYVCTLYAEMLNGEEQDAMAAEARGPRPSFIVGLAVRGSE